MDTAGRPDQRTTDDEILDAAREIYVQLQETPRWSDERPGLLGAWGVVCMEMNLRGLTDHITTEHAATDRPHTSNARLRVIFTSE
jgi:hypothetical protein